MPDHTGPRSFGRSSFLLLGAFILTRAILPLFPSGPWSPSGYLCAWQYLFLPLGRPHTCIARAAFGEGARVTNRLDFVSYRREVFTVDERGYRNPAFPPGTRPSVILAGSSFSLGLGLTDEDTLSAQLNRQLGPIVYNASNVLNEKLSARDITPAARSLGVSRGWVLLELLNRISYRYEPMQARESALQVRKEKLLNRIAPLHSLERQFVNPFALTRVSSAVNMRIDNGRLLPNPYANLFAEEALTNGQRMLFLAQDKSFFDYPASPEETIRAVTQLRNDLSGAGLNLAVILVPTSYSVYYPLLRDRTGHDSGAQYIAALAAQLSAHHVPVFDGLPLMRDTASRELSAGRLIYWPDDAHWNPEGVQAFVHGAVPWLSALLASHQ